MKKRRGHKTKTDSLPARGLKHEDALLWHRITETLTPIGNDARNRVLPHTHAPQFQEPPSPDTGNKKSSITNATRTGSGGKFLQSKHQPIRPPAPPPVNPIEKSLNRKIARGVTGFDARIDLHGMTQSQAHGALLAFLRSCQARGCRVALVITGKGRTDESGQAFTMHSGPGVLRRSIRGWLEQPEFRSLAAAYAPAHRRHGGEGALYVQIRRQRHRSD